MTEKVQSKAKKKPGRLKGRKELPQGPRGRRGGAMQWRKLREESVNPAWEGESGERGPTATPIGKGQRVA